MGAGKGKGSRAASVAVNGAGTSSGSTLERAIKVNARLRRRNIAFGIRVRDAKRTGHVYASKDLLRDWFALEAEADRNVLAIALVAERVQAESGARGVKARWKAMRGALTELRRIKSDTSATAADTSAVGDDIRRAQGRAVLEAFAGLASPWLDRKDRELTVLRNELQRLAAKPTLTELEERRKKYLSLLKAGYEVAIVAAGTVGGGASLATGLTLGAICPPAGCLYAAFTAWHVAAKLSRFRGRSPSPSAAFAG